MTRRTWFAVVGVVVVLGATGWASGAGSSGRSSTTPLKCSPADTRAQRVLRNGVSTRYCGRARAVVYVNGETYRISGGLCYPRQRRGARRHRFEGVAVGLYAAPPAGLSFTTGGLTPGGVTRPGPIWIPDTETEVAGKLIVASGVLVLNGKLNGGWFSLYGRDASGPTGPLVSGSWTCG